MLNIASNEYSLHGAAYSNIGGRPENQDSLCVCETQLGLLVVVSDGMGGGPGGKTASSIAVQVIANTVSGYPAGASKEDALKVAVGRANDALAAKVREVPQLAGMGATAIVALIDRQSAVIANIGDSRCYRIGKGKTIFRTKDHSLVGELVRRNVLTEEQARTSPQSNVITKALGTTNDHVPDIDEVCYNKGDRLVLCTDGVWGSMTDNEFVMRLSAPLEVGNMVDNLASEVDRIGYSKGGHHDNHTMAVIEMDDNSIKTDSMSKTIKIVLAALGALLAISVVFNIVCFLKLRNNDYVEELNRKNRLIETLEPYRMRYEKMCENKGDALKVTMEERDSLFNVVLDLRQKVDSLIKSNEAAREQAGKPGGENLKPTAADKSVKGKPSASECVDNLVKSLTQLRDASAASQSQTVKLKEKYRDEAKKHLKQYVEIKSISNNDIDNIRRLLNSDKITKVDKSKDNVKYVSTRTVKNDIDKAIERAKKLK